MNKNTKKQISIILSALMTVSIGGCGKKDLERASDSSPEIIEDNEDVLEKENQKLTDFAWQSATYDEILQYCINLLSVEDVDEIELDEDSPFTGLLENRIGYSKEEALANTGYAIRDLNKDGIDELIIGSMIDDPFEYSEANQIYDVFTMDDTEVRLLFQGWSRNCYYANITGGYLNEASNGASSSLFTTFKLDGTPLVIVNDVAFFTEYDKNDNQAYVYSNLEGKWDLETSTKQEDITEETFIMQQEENERWLIHTDLKSFETYAMLVSVCYLEDYGGETDSCEWVTLDNSQYASHLVFQAKEDVSDLKIYQLFVADVDDNGNITYYSNFLYEQSQLTVELPLGIDLTFDGDASLYGLTYEDSKENINQFIIGQSGMDGSVYLSSYQFME